MLTIFAVAAYSYCALISSLAVLNMCSSTALNGLLFLFYCVYYFYYYYFIIVLWIDFVFVLDTIMASLASQLGLMH
jgi:hypothetical protein